MGQRERQALRVQADRLADAITDAGHSPILFGKLSGIEAQIATVDANDPLWM